MRGIPLFSPDATTFLYCTDDDKAFLRARNDNRRKTEFMRWIEQLQKIVFVKVTGVMS